MGVFLDNISLSHLLEKLRKTFVKKSSLGSGAFCEIDTFPEEYSGDLITSGGVYAAIYRSAVYHKPFNGIPKTDLDNSVQTSLGKADTALQSFTESDPTVPAWAKAVNKPSYTAQEVGALPDSTTIPTKVSDLTNDSGFTSNTGTITGITMNGASKGTSGVVNLGTVITAHQDISGKADVAALAGYTPTSGFATINGASITDGGNIVITAGSSSITTIDATPTSGSTNPVQSGGVYDAIEGGFYY